MMDAAAAAAVAVAVAVAVAANGSSTLELLGNCGGKGCRLLL